jgi:hypothetical protein
LTCRWNLGDNNVKPGSQPTVAIIGARGIGRHHAHWWSRAGVEVAAVAGTNPAALPATVKALQDLFGFAGRTYTDVPAMLATEKPDFVDVCSPPDRHFEHCRLALAAGAHVLCEKPFLFEPGRDAAGLLAQADELIRLAADRGLSLGLGSQHAVTAESCWRLFKAARPGETVTAFEAQLASPGKPGVVDPAPTWIDLGPHLLAAVQALAPDAVLVPGSIATEFSPDHARCQFEVTRRVGAKLACRLHAFRTRGQPSHVRQLALNGLTFDLDGARGPDGIYFAKLVSSLGTHAEDDPMRQLIRRFAAGDPPLDAAAARQNLAWLLAVLAATYPAL